MSAVIRIENLTKVYCKKTILNQIPGYSKREITVFENLNLEIPEGEVFGLLGLNGAGKTTLMKVLLGLIFPTRGNAWILGKRIGNIEIKKRIGFLPEMPYFSKNSTPEEILNFYAKLFGLEDHVREKRINETLELVGLSEKRWQKLREFSKGMLQKVGIAQLLINDPDLLFLDEPTFGLDPLACKEMRDIILAMKKKKKTIFLSSHQIGEVEKICDRIGILHSGKLINVGKVVLPLEDYFVNAVTVKNKCRRYPSGVAFG